MGMDSDYSDQNSYYVGDNQFANRNDIMGAFQGYQAQNQAAQQNAGYFNGVDMNGAMSNTPVSGQAPSFNLNTLADNQMLGQQLSAGGQGSMTNGVRAFMPDNWNMPTLQSNSGSEDRGMSYNWGGYGGGSNNYDTTNGVNGGGGNSLRDIIGLARSTGMDLSNYDLNSQDSQMSMFNGNKQVNGMNSLKNLYDTVNSNLGDYYNVRGLSSMWDQGAKPRDATSTIYHQANNTLTPVSQTGHYTAPEQRGGWLQNDGSEMLAAMSTVLPAFGGWSGILGNGVGGTLTAGGGLGLTGSLGSMVGNAGLANMMVNTGVGAALNGGRVNPISMIPGLAQGALGSLGSTGDLSNMFGSGQNIGAPSYSNLGQLMNTGIGQSINQMPFFRTAEGQGIRGLMQGGQSLANLFRS